MHRHRTIQDLESARARLACAVFSRRTIGDADGRGELLQRPLSSRSYGGRERGPGRVPGNTLAGRGTGLLRPWFAGALRWGRADPESAGGRFSAVPLVRFFTEPKKRFSDRLGCRRF